MRLALLVISALCLVAAIATLRFKSDGSGQKGKLQVDEIVGTAEETNQPKSEIERDPRGSEEFGSQRQAVLDSIGLQRVLNAIGAPVAGVFITLDPIYERFSSPETQWWQVDWTKIKENRLQTVSDSAGLFQFREPKIPNVTATWASHPQYAATLLSGGGMEYKLSRWEPTTVNVHDGSGRLVEGTVVTIIRSLHQEAASCGSFASIRWSEETP